MRYNEQICAILGAKVAHFRRFGKQPKLTNLNKPSADDVFSRCWIYNDCILYGLRLLAWIISCPNGPKFPIFSGLFVAISRSSGKQVTG